MNNTERGLLDLAKTRKKDISPDKFRSWLRGFRMVGTESKELARKLDELREE